MRLTEFITIYLAAAAPFGVAHFLRTSELGRTNARRLMKSALAALVWPVAAFTLFSRTKDELRDAASEREHEDEREVERLKRALVGALREVEDALAPARGAEAERDRHTFFTAREAVERYVGLTLATRGLDADAAPTAREMELCRVAGRTGEDLLNAGRCVHRRNVIRLKVHRERARTELFHALAATRETATARQSSIASSARARTCETLIETFARAVELLTRLEDGAAVLRVARLLEAERAHLRRLAVAPDANATTATSSSPVNVPPNAFGVAAGDRLNV